MSVAFARTICTSSEQRKKSRANLASNVAKKRSTLPELKVFGAFLRRSRGNRSREQIARKLEQFGAKIDESTLVQYEKGAVWSPDPTVLAGLAQIYEVRTDWLISLLVENRKDPNARTIEYLPLPSMDDPESEPQPILTADQRHLLQMWNKLPPELRQHVLTMIGYIAAHGIAGSTGEKSA